jgi:hypothetical protein
MNMIDERYIESINKELDGENTPEESVALKSYLERNPKANELFEDLRSLFAEFDQIRPIDPPRSLKPLILNSIDVSRYQRNRASLFGRLFKNVAEVWRAKSHALVFSAGVVAGVLVLAMFFDLRIPDDRGTTALTGTIISDEATKHFRAGDAFRVDLGPVQVGLSTKYSNNIVAAELELHSTEEVEVVFGTNGNSLCFSAFKQEEGGTGHLVVGENTSRLKSVGNQTYVLFFTDKKRESTPLDFKVMQQGKILYERTVLPRKKE